MRHVASKCLKRLKLPSLEVAALDFKKGLDGKEGGLAEKRWESVCVLQALKHTSQGMLPTPLSMYTAT